MNQVTLVAPLGLMLLASTASVHAQDAANYPSRPIRMVVPNAPGSSVDTLSRIMAMKLSEVLGQQVVMDNRAGAGGVIGMEIAKARESGRLHAHRRDDGSLDHRRAAAEKSHVRPGEGLRLRRAVRRDAQRAGRQPDRCR